MPYKDPEKKRANHRAYYLATREETLKRDRERYAANPEKQKAATRARALAHPEKKRTGDRAYRLKNLAKILAKDRAYKAARREKLRRDASEYQKLHPEVSKRTHARRKARKKQLPDTFTRDDYRFVIEYWHFACAICGNQEGFHWTLALDHWIPLDAEHCPGTVPTNMLPLCHGQGGCNNSKYNRDGITWLHERYPPAQARKILKAINTYFALVRQ